MNVIHKVGCDGNHWLGHYEKYLLQWVGIILFLLLNSKEEYGIIIYSLKLSILLFIPSLSGVLKWYYEINTLTEEEIKELKIKNTSLISKLR